MAINQRLQIRPLEPVEDDDCSFASSNIVIDSSYCSQVSSRFDEFVTRLGQSIYTPTISNDISGERGKTALAQDIDRTCYGGLPPYASYVARTIFIHSIAFPSTLQGIAPDHLRFSVLAPALDLGFIDDARKRFQEKSAYLDDRPNAPLRFLTEANLTQIIERQKQLCDPGTIRDELNDRIARTYLAGEFELNKFPGTAGEVQDEVGAIAIPVIASGGFASLDDVHALLAPRAHKLGGAIIGRALYDGRLDAAAALQLIRAARAA